MACVSVSVRGFGGVSASAPSPELYVRVGMLAVDRQACKENLPRRCKQDVGGRAAQGSVRHVGNPWTLVMSVGSCQQGV